MGVLLPVASVTDVINEFNVSGATPVTLFNVSNISSGQIFDKITEANATLQGWMGIGSSTQTDAAINEAQKRFEVCYASARLAADLAGIVITEGFNYTAAGVAVNRQTAEQQAYTMFIKNHLDIAKYYLMMLNPWFYMYNPSFPQGYNEYGNPVVYNAVSRGY